jgi:hypothetical protein
MLFEVDPAPPSVPAEAGGENIMPELERTTSEAMVSAKNGCQVGNFTRLKQEEKNIIVKGQESVPLLLDQLFEIEREINANEAAQKKQRILGLVASILGSSLLLFVNLVAENESK